MKELAGIAVELATYQASSGNAHVRVQSCAASHAGSSKKNNDDRFLLKPPVFAVADGVGQLPKGDVAAEIAVDTLGTPVPSAKTALLPTMRKAHTAIRAKASSDLRYSGMATTLTAAYLAVGSSQITLTIGHIGDSRAYEIKDRKLILQITRDHSMANRIIHRGKDFARNTRQDPSNHQLARALGLIAPVEVDTTTLYLLEPTTLLLCTDGVWTVLEDFELVDLVHSASNVKDAATSIVTEAVSRNEANATAVVASIIPRFDT